MWSGMQTAAGGVTLLSKPQNISGKHQDGTVLLGTTPRTSGKHPGGVK